MNGYFTISLRTRSETSTSDGLVSYPGHSLGWESLTLLQRCSQCILRLNGLKTILIYEKRRKKSLNKWTQQCYIYIYIYIIFSWCMSQPSFDHSFKNLMCLATLNEELWYNETVYMLPYPCGVELSSKVTVAICVRQALEWIELSVAIKADICKQNKNDT